MDHAQKLVVHVADIEVSEESGMGRIAWHWRNEFLRRGYEYVHIGPTQVGSLPHRGLFPYAAYREYQRLGKQADFFLLHEAASSPFLNRKIPTAVFSHGLDRRSWEEGLQRGNQVRWISKIIYPLWRIRHCDLGIKQATVLLYSNYEDIGFTKDYYHRGAEQIYVFKNGVYPLALDETVQPEELTIGFLASWIERKGYKTLIQAAELLLAKGLQPRYLLAGTGSNPETILSHWPAQLQPFVEVIPAFPRSQEPEILAKTTLFVLPSYFEGQPLSLLQAMESGRCCITTNCCGQRDVIQHGYNGFLHQAGDAEKLAELLEQCIRDQELRTTLARNAKQSVQNRQWETVSAELVDWLETSLG